MDELLQRRQLGGVRLGDDDDERIKVAGIAPDLSILDSGREDVVGDPGRRGRLSLPRG